MAQNWAGWQKCAGGPEFNPIAQSQAPTAIDRFRILEVYVSTEVQPSGFLGVANTRPYH